MPNTLKATMAAVAFTFPTIALAAGSYECGFQPLPPGTTLHYLVYSTVDDVTATSDTFDAYNSLVRENPSYFSQYRPSISFIDHPDDISLFASISEDFPVHYVTIVIGDAQSAMDIQARSALVDNTVTLVPDKEAIDPDTLQTIEDSMEFPYYAIASTHAIRLGTNLLVGNPGTLSTITIDHILDSP